MGKPSLRDLAGREQDLARHAVSENTHSAYAVALRSFLDFTQAYSEIKEPITEPTVRLWLTHLATVKKLSPKSVHSYFSSLKYHWENLGGDRSDLDDNDRIDRIIKGIARTADTSKRTNQKQEPLTAELFWTAVATTYPAGLPRDYQATLQLAAITMGIFGVFCPGEFLTTSGKRQRPEAILRLQQLSLTLERFDDGKRSSCAAPATSSIPTGHRIVALNVHLNCSKTDQLKAGADVTIADSGAIRLITDYLKLHPRKNSLDAQAFVHQDMTPMTSNQLTSAIRTLLDQAGVADHERYTGRSLRKGGAQTLLDNGDTLQSIGHAGRWTNTVTPSRYYVKHSSASKIHAAQRMTPRS